MTVGWGGGWVKQAIVWQLSEVHLFLWSHTFLQTLGYVSWNLFSNGCFKIYYRAVSILLYSELLQFSLFLYLLLVWIFCFVPFFFFVAQILYLNQGVPQWLYFPFKEVFCTAGCEYTKYGFFFFWCWGLLICWLLKASLLETVVQHGGPWWPLFCWTGQCNKCLPALSLHCNCESLLYPRNFLHCDSWHAQRHVCPEYMPHSSVFCAFVLHADGSLV